MFTKTRQGHEKIKKNFKTQFDRNMCNEGNGLLSRGKIWQMFEHVLGRTSLDYKLQNWTDEKSVSLSPSHVSP